MRTETIKNMCGGDGEVIIRHILGEKEQLPKNSHLQISNMNLQKLFVKLTEKGGR